MSNKTNPVLVMTAHKGVFFGYLNDEQVSKEEVTITDARCCVYWSESLRGVLGLAEKGPCDKCRVGPPVKTLRLYDITAAADCTDDAVKAWESAPWA